ncbi:MAG: arginyl-tRNA synthetase [Parcubacteria group bacterium Gr01-1014_72]|nr:MAG: arginyl-tRNA synthetase [Parcubacteria group bacterium Gr01-1014_72]
MIQNTLHDLNVSGADFSVEHTADFSHGDYATNVALVSAKAVKTSPHALAEKIAGHLETKLPSEIEKVEVAGAGFINFTLSAAFLSVALKNAASSPNTFGNATTHANTKVIVEYTDPNPFKEFHIGHLMSNTIGEAISRLIASRGAEVKRACYQGDVGLHVAKALYGAKQANPKNASEWGKAYALGASLYEENESAKKEIEIINKAIYERNDSVLNALYDGGRKVSLEYFETIYKRLGTHFDFYFFESEMSKPGLTLVREFLKKGVFEESNGVLVFKAEKYNTKLHTRVYITSQGLPTYETKELGLHFTKAKTYPADQSIIITANEQDSVYAVGLEALRHIDPKLFEKTKHLSHGMLRLPTGKMSSRTGNVITAEWLIDEVKGKVREKIAERDFAPDEKEKITEAVAIAAIKYSILRQAVGGDIIFDFEKSISFEGDSGPYLQYAYVRAMSVLQKAQTAEVRGTDAESAAADGNIELARRLVRFPDVVARAAEEYAPHYLVTYLTEFASAFNNFYARVKIIGSPDEAALLALTRAVSTVLKNGLTLLGMPVVERM